MFWRTDKPTEKVIVAKLTEDFCHLKDSYAILRLANEPYQHYSEDGEEIPYAAIEKWASLEEKPSEDLEKEIEARAEEVPSCDFCHYSNIIEREAWCKEQFRHFYELGKDSKVSGENGKNFTIGR